MMPSSPGGKMLSVQRMHAFFLSLGRHLSDRLSFGVNTKIIWQTIGDYSAYGIGFDTGLMYRWKHGITLAAMLHDLTGTYVIWNTRHKDIRSPTFKFGISYSRHIPQLKGNLIIVGDHELGSEKNKLDEKVQFLRRNPLFLEGACPQNSYHSLVFLTFSHGQICFFLHYLCLL